MVAEPVGGRSHSEQVFYFWHYRASRLCLRRTSRKFRGFLEFFFMLLAIINFAALICLHIAFVYRGHPAQSGASNNVVPGNHRHSLRSGIPLTCLSSIKGFRRDADVTHVVLLSSGGQESFAYHLGVNETKMSACAAKDLYECPSSLPEEPSGSFSDVYYSYSQVKGYAYLTPELSKISDTRDISTQIVAISKTDARCFGEPFLQQAVFRLLGPEVVMMNWLLAISDGTGYIYNPRTDKLLDLRHYHITNTRNSKPSGFNLSASTIFDMSNWSSWFRPWAAKFATVLKTCLIYFISTNIVSFLLRVAQERLLELSLQVKTHQQAGRSIIPLFVTHVADCFVFVPITAGVVFFLREFYQGDWQIALMVLTVLWFCEAFSFISVRSVQGIHFFPRAIFLLFALVHFYLFSFPFGFSYVAMVMIVCFMTQCCLFFWNRYELPAVALGLLEPPSRLEYPGIPVENDLITATHNILRHRLVTDDSATPSMAPLSLAHSPNGRFQEEHITLSRREEPREIVNGAQQQQQQQQQQQRSIQHTYSQSNFSQGRMSRASSEAIFRGATDGDDESESCIYFLGGEVVLRRRDSGGNNAPYGGSTGDSVQLQRYDSTSTIHSNGGVLETIDDEERTSGLQAIQDLTPKLCNRCRSGSELIEEGPSGGAPAFPVLGEDESSPQLAPHRSLRRQNNRFDHQNESEASSTSWTLK